MLKDNRDWYNHEGDFSDPAAMREVISEFMAGECNDAHSGDFDHSTRALYIIAAQLCDMNRSLAELVKAVDFLGPPLNRIGGPNNGV